jgi:hypothetical protein
MIENKSQLILKAREVSKINQYDHKFMNPSKTKLGPSFQSSDQWTGASWHPSDPISEKYKERFETLGKKYKDLSWSALDIPKFKIDDIDKFKEIWNREKIEIKRLLPSEDEPWSSEEHPLGENSSWNRVEFYGLHITCNATLDFNIHDLYVNGTLKTPQYSNENGFRQGRTAQGTFTKKLYKDKFFSNIIVQIMDHFPIRVLNNIMILEPKNDVLPHREQTWAWQCPTEFRIALYDENDKPTYYVSHIETGQTNYIDLPDTTNSFCWSNGTHIYGMDFYNKLSYQIVVNAIWDDKKLDNLLEKSIGKYGIFLEKN